MHRSTGRHLPFATGLLLGFFALIAGFLCTANAGPAPEGAPAVNTFREIRCFKGHTDAVWGAAFSPDGRRALSGSYDRSVRLWDVETGKELLKLADFPAPVMAVAFLPDGQMCVASCSDGSAHFCDLKLGKRVRGMQAHDGSANSLDVSADGMLLATGGADGVVKIWDCATGTAKRALAGSTDWIWSVAFSPNGKQVLAGGADKTARVWDIETGKEVVQLNSHKDSINAVAFAADGKQALTASTDGEVRLWGLDKGHVIRQMSGSKSPIYSVLFSREGRHAFSAGADGIIRTWECSQQVAQPNGLAMRGRGRPALVMDSNGNPISAEAGKETRRYEGHDGAVYHLALSRDGRYLLSSGRDGTVRLWETRGIDAELHAFAHPGPVDVAVFTNDGARIATVSMGYSRVWNLDQGTLNRQTPLFGRGPGRRSADYELRNDFSTNASVLSQAGVLPPSNQTGLLSPTGTLAVWNGDVGAIIRTLELSRGKALFQAAVFTRDGKEAITGDSEGRVIAWDMQSGKELRSRHYPGCVVTSLAIADNDRDILAAVQALATTGPPQNPSVRRLERSRLEEKHNFARPGSPITALAFAPDGRGFLSSSTKGIVTWCEVEGNGNTKVFPIPGGRIGAMAFVKADQFVTGGGDYSVRQWNLRDGKEVQRFDGHQATITGLAYSQAKKMLLSASADHSVRIWKMDPAPAESLTTNVKSQAGKSTGSGLPK